MATGTLKRLAVPGLVTDSLATIYTVPGATKAIGIAIGLMNDDTALDITVSIHIIPSAGSATATNKRYKGSSPNGLYLKPGETKTVLLEDILETGEFIQLIASTTNKVSYRISGMEVT
jgi:hypothetical protein